MFSKLSPQVLVERAVDLLRAAPGFKGPQASLLIWVHTVQEDGSAEACKKLPQLAGRWTDWCITEAIEVVARDDDRWPVPQQKIEAVAEILSERKTKAEIRAIAASR